MSSTVQPDQATTAFAKAAVAKFGNDGPTAIAGASLHDTLTLPPHVAALVREMLTMLAEGRTVELEPSSSEMTPTEAAAYLNVSRPYCMTLLEEGKLPFRMVGTHHRIPTSDMITYKRITRARQHQALDELVHIGEELDLYDSDDGLPAKDTYRGKSSTER